MQRRILRNVRNRWFPGQQHLLFEKTSRYAIISWGDEGGDSEIAGRNQTVEDLRRSWGNLRHKLEDILVIGLCSVICMGEDFELFGQEREEWLHTFLELPNGIPDSDTFRHMYPNGWTIG